MSTARHSVYITERKIKKLKLPGFKKFMDLFNEDDNCELSEFSIMLESRADYMGDKYLLKNLPLYEAFCREFNEKTNLTIGITTHADTPNECDDIPFWEIMDYYVITGPGELFKEYISEEIFTYDY